MNTAKVSGKVYTYALLFQFPVSLLEITDHFLPKPDLRSSYPVATLMVFALSWFLGAFSTAATYLAVKYSNSGQAFSFGGVVRDLQSRAGLIFRVQGLVGLYVLLGFALILPGFYFLGVFLYSLFWALEGQDSSPSCLQQSKQTARAHWKATALFVAVSTGLGLTPLLFSSRVEPQWLTPLTFLFSWVSTSAFVLWVATSFHGWHREKIV